MPRSSTTANTRLTFPPRDARAVGRDDELRRLSMLATRPPPGAIALVGPGGSGKSTLAATLGHHVVDRFPGGIHWFRVGAWSAATLLTMLAVRFGSGRRRVVPGLRRYLGSRGPTFVVLDNHEDDEATAEVLNALESAPVFWTVTARRCLLAGVTVYPVTPPMVLEGASPYPSVSRLTSLLRHNPLSLSVADALVRDRVTTVRKLDRFLRDNGAHRIQVIADEDDLPEVRLLVDFAWKRLSAASRRLLGVLAHAGGDHVDRASLLSLGRARKPEALATLLRWCLVQEPFRERYALHATVRRAVLPRVAPIDAALFEHYVGLLERAPERLDAEQTHLFAAMDHAARGGSLNDRLRVSRLLRALDL